ncbi:hypothetical protein NLJ89_g11419 [Agrocybe chaxingu]|uniref:Uncharacterized protein n=1 Tax=Agrocybe chaxingu TaxID=84603 RepID=A0A9W8JSE8_9AGAR|nr:hypothetical protein NLJ89_g11419 [Agrocybe chaxingu]
MGASLHLEPACESGSGQTAAESLEELHFLERHWMPVPMAEITNFGSGFGIGGGGGFAGGACGGNHGHAVRGRGKLGSHFGGWVCVNPSTTPASPTTSSTSSTASTPLLSPSSSTSTVFEVKLDGATATVPSLEKENEIEERGQEQALAQESRPAWLIRTASITNTTHILHTIITIERSKKRTANTYIKRSHTLRAQNYHKKRTRRATLSSRTLRCIAMASTPRNIHLDQPILLPRRTPRVQPTVETAHRPETSPNYHPTSAIQQRHTTSVPPILMTRTLSACQLGEGK